MGEVSSYGDDPAEQKEDEDGPAEHKEDEDGGRNQKISEASPVYNDHDKSLQHSTTVFVFWAYVVAFVSLISLSVVIISSIMPSDADTEFFSMPPEVRHHSSKGKHLKINIGPDRIPIKVFAIEEGPPTFSEYVVLLHGLGASSFTYRYVIQSLALRGLHVIALDFPGAGLSEKPTMKEGGFVSKLREIYDEISERGLFWRFEQMFETGSFPDTHRSASEIRYDSETLTESLAQVISLLASSPVHMVLHDTSVEAGLTWAIRNPSLVRSITLIDAYPGVPSFPAGLLGFPGIGFMVLKSSFLHQWLLQLCCVTQLTRVEAGCHAFLLNSNDGKGAMLKTWETQNTTFDTVSSINAFGKLPLQILWSRRSGKSWQELGDWLASQLSSAQYISHNGGRWPQEDDAVEITEKIYEFVSSLPQTVHSFAADRVPQHAQETFTGNENFGQHKVHTCDYEHGEHNHDNGYGHDSHNHGSMHHDHGLGFMGHGGWVI